MKKNLNKKYLLQIVFLLFLVVGTVSAYFLNQQNQDVRQQASTGSGIVEPKTNYIGPSISIEGNAEDPPELIDPRYLGPPETIGNEDTTSNRCEPCNNSVSPSTPYSRCAAGLVCKTEAPKCYMDSDGREVCPQLVGVSGICVKTNEEISVCQNNNPISLTGDTLPNDPRIVFQTLTVNEKLLPFQPDIFASTVDLNSQDLTIEDGHGEPGYGEFFMFYPTPGMNFEILAKELDINTVGSYIETVFYGPDKKKITQVGTRIQHTSPSRLPYYLVVYTFDHKQGRAEITVSNKSRIYNSALTKRIDQDSQPLAGGSKLGRKAADFFLQVPRIDNINNNYITYTTQTDNTLTTYIPRVKVAQVCPLTRKSMDIPITITRINNPNSSDPLREIRMKIAPASVNSATSAYYPPGYEYIVDLEYPNPNMGWRTSFFTTSQSGLMTDLNDDGSVDLSDYSLLTSEFMKTTQSKWPSYLISDLNCDGIVDISDYSLLISNISL